MKDKLNLRENTRVVIVRYFFKTALCAMPLILAASCGQKQSVTANQAMPSPSPTQTVSPPQKAEPKTYHGEGVVTKIVLENPYDKSLSSVELNHGEIVGLMPAMQMEFYVKEKSLLKGLKVGDKVDFTLEATESAEIVSEIKKK
ncbi:MAG TPA: copper-binding protein [Pyrinomonadaceae bacterium]|jgi:Cu/Ag efflux protein CusF